MLQTGKIQTFGGTCPSCCGDLYLSSYSGGWSLRCIYCQLELTETRRPSGSAVPTALPLNHTGGSGHAEVASPYGV